MAVNSVIKVTCTWLDFEGESSTTVFYGAVDNEQKWVDIHGWANAKAITMEPLTNANLSRVTISQDDFYTGLVPAQFEGEAFSNAEDKLFLLMENNNGKAARLNIPAPKTADFKGDLETWNPSTSPLSTFYANYLTIDDGDQGTGSFVSDPDGVRLVQMVDGYRRRVKTKKERGGRATAIG